MNTGLHTLFAYYVLTTFFEGIDAGYNCLVYKYSSWGFYFYTYQNCPYGCCGSGYSADCCSFDFPNTTASTVWTAGVIIGCVVAGIVVLSIIIAIIICAVKAATKSGSTGRVVHPAPPNQPVFHMSNTASQQYSHSAVAMAPPPYTGPGVVHSAPAPVYHGTPGQSSGLTGVDQPTGLSKY